MKPPFYQAVDQVFLYILELIERINSGEQIDADEERTKICARLDVAETNLGQVGQAEDWELAKYAIVAWIDEMLSADLWPANPLEFQIFRSSKRWHEFYNRAELAMGLTRKDAIECFYIAVVLGFRGMYSSEDALSEGREFLEFEPPESLEAWARRAAGVIQIANDVPKPSAAPKPLPGAPLHDGKFDCIAAWMMAAVLVVGIAFLYWFS